MTPIVEEALKSLTIRVNLSTGLLHPQDECAAKELFQMLSKAGELLHATEIAEWASRNNWQDKHAKALGELAQKINQGGRVVIRHKGQWKADFMKQLRARVAASTL